MSNCNEAHGGMKIWAKVILHLYKMAIVIGNLKEIRLSMKKKKKCPSVLVSALNDVSQVVPVS